MTWANFTATGIGADGIDYRLVVEGSRYQFVTSEEMVGATYGDNLAAAATWSGVGVVTTGQADPVGGTDASLLTDDDAANYESAEATASGYVSGEPVAVELWIKKATTAVTHFSSLNLNYDASTVLQVSFRHDIDSTSVTLGAATDVEMVEAVVGWWRLRFKHAGAVATTVSVAVYPGTGPVSTFPTGAVTTTGAITVYGASIKIPDGVTRVGGLLREGLGFSESAYLAGAELAISINAIRIIETPYPHLDSASSIFAALPSTKCYLASTLETAATSMVVDSAADLAVGDFVHSATEVIEVTALVGTTATVARGRWRTTAQRHTVTTSAGRPAVRPLRDGARVWAGRRCWLYAHGASETGVTDEGAVVWRGRLADNPTLDADSITWNLPIGSRWDLLDQEIGADLDKPRALRGAYYPGNFPFVVFARTNDAALRSGTYTGDPAQVSIVGHYETNEDFLDALVTALAAALPAYGFGWSIADGQWDLLITTQAASEKYLVLWGGSPTDGWFTGGLIPQVDETGREAAVGTVVASTTYIAEWAEGPAFLHFLGARPPTIPFADMRRIPRSINSPSAFGTAADIASHPTARCYLDDTAGIVAGDTLLISQRAAEGEDDPPAVSRVVGSVNASAGSVTSTGVNLGFVASGATTTEIKVSKSYGAAGGITLAGFRDALISEAPEGANDGSTPWVLADDLASWTANVTAASDGHDYLQRRLYEFYQGARTSDVIKQECRAYGLFPYLDADFKVALRPLTLNTEAVSLAFYIDADDGTLITEDSFGEMTSGEDGNVNVVEFARGYDPIEDKHAGGSVFAVTVEGVSESKKRRILEVKPKARPVGSDVTYEEALRLSDPVRSLFGGLIQIYAVTVPGTFWSVLVGDTVVVTSPQLPYGGARTVHDPGLGMITRAAVVVGRDWDLERGTGKLTLLVTGLNVAGYAPSARATTWTGATTTWDVECEAARYSPSGGQDVSYFTVGDRIRVIEWDAASPTTERGSVTAVDLVTNTLSLLLDGAIVPGSTVFNIEFDNSDLVVATQRAYCYVASSTKRIADGSDGTTARVFAP